MFARIKQLKNGMSGPLIGALWMTSAAASFAALTTIIRHLSTEMHAFELAFFRNSFGLMFMLPWFWKTGLKSLQTNRIGLHGFRSVIGLTAMLCWFLAIGMMPLADATALSFTAPLFATVGAALFLGEIVRVRRWGATLIGFVGAIIIVRPAGLDIGMASVLALAASAFMAGAALSVKSLSRTDSPNTIVLYMGLLMTPLSLIPALLYWTQPTLEHLPWFLGLGLFATTGQLSMARSFAAADASAVLPFDFSRLIFAAMLGFLFFAETPDVWTWTGAAIIFTATLYTAHRETQLDKGMRPARAALRQTMVQTVAPSKVPAKEQDR